MSNLNFVINLGHFRSTSHAIKILAINHDLIYLIGSKLLIIVIIVKTTVEAAPFLFFLALMHSQVVINSFILYWIRQFFRKHQCLEQESHDATGALLTAAALVEATAAGGICTSLAGYAGYATHGFNISPL